VRRLILIVLLTVFLSAIFSVNSYAQECQRSRPVITVSPSSVTGPLDNTYALTLTIRNEDTQTCGFTSFNIATSLPTGWTSFIHITPKSIFPQQSELISIDVKVPKDAATQQHQVILVVDSPSHKTTTLKASATALITIREEPKSCTISVDDIKFRKASTDVEKITFCLKEMGDIDTKISLRGNAQSQVSVNLLIDGKLVGSDIVNIFPDNFATINFNNTINTQVYGKSTPNAKVVAKATCASSESTREKLFTIDICDPSCLFTTSIAAPLEKQVGQDAITSIYTRNIGNKENLIAIEQSVCKGDCTPMVCELYSVKLQPEESKSYTCRQKVKDTGSHNIETKIFACGNEESQTKSFFGVATAQPATPSIAEECEVGPLPEFRCSGSIRQQLFSNSDCSTTWVYSQYCPDGCSKGLCISTGEEVRGFEPIVALDEKFEGKNGKDASLTFEVENTINSPAKFDVKVGGKAAEWISVPSSIIIGEKAKEQISFSVSIPSEAKSGDYDFTVTVSTGTRSTSKSSLIKVVEEEQPSISIEVIFAVIGGLLVVFVLLLFLQSRSDRKEAF